MYDGKWLMFDVKSYFDYVRAGNYWRWLKKKLNTEGVQLVSALTSSNSRLLTVNNVRLLPLLRKRRPPRVLAHHRCLYSLRLNARIII